MSFVLRARVAAVLGVAGYVSLFIAPVLAEDDSGQVVVTANRVEQPVSDVIGSVTVITREEIERRQVQSLPDLLRGEAGIDVTNNGGLGKLSSVFMRGANPSQTLFLVNGQRLGSATAGTTTIEFIPIDQIERVEIVRGPRSSLYGSDAMGGVIQIFTRQPDGVAASVSYGSYNTQDYSAGFGFNAAGLRVSVNGDYLQSKGFNACYGDGVNFSGGCYIDEPDNDGYRNLSASARVGYAFGTVADLELSTLFAQGYNEYDGSQSAGNEARFRQSVPAIKLTVTPIDAVRVTTNASITQDKSSSFHDGVFVEAFSTPFFPVYGRFNTEKRNASLQTDWTFIKGHTLTVGGDYLQDRIDSDTPYDVTSRSNGGVFAQYLGKFAAQEFSASARHDHNGQFGNADTGSLGWKWFVLDRALAVNAGWGKAFHAPTFNDLYYPTDIYYGGNPNLKPERSRSYELGLSGEYRALSWSAQAFETKTDDLIVLVTDLNDPNFFTTPVNVQSARMRGLEVTTAAQLNALRLSANYTYLDPRSLGGATDRHFLPRRARQSGRIDASYDMGRAQVSATLTAAGPRYDDLANTARLGGYTTLDFNTNVELCKALTLQVRLANFFDRRYETAHFFNQEGRALYVTLRYQGWRHRADQ